MCNARSGFEIHSPAAHKKDTVLRKCWLESLLKLQEYLLNCEANPINDIKSEWSSNIKKKKNSKELNYNNNIIILKDDWIISVNSQKSTSPFDQMQDLPENHFCWVEHGYILIKIIIIITWVTNESLILVENSSMNL